MRWLMPLLILYLCTAMAVLPLTFKTSKALLAYLLLAAALVGFCSIHGYSISQKSHLGAQAPWECGLPVVPGLFACLEDAAFAVSHFQFLPNQANEEEGQHFTCCLRPFYLSLPIQVAFL